MRLSTRLAKKLIRLPRNRILDSVISRLLQREKELVAFPSRKGYLLHIGGEDRLVCSYRASAALGLYEPEFFRLLSKFIDPGSVVFDVGANEGFVSMHLSNLVGNEGHVFAFEPHPVNVARLEDNIRINERTNVTVIAKAASDRKATVTLHNDRLWGTMIETVYPSGSLIEVETITLDEFATYCSCLDRLRLVKIDVEGHELQVVRGGRDMLMDTRPIVAFEVNLNLLAYAEYSIQELFRFFLDNNYKLFIEQGGELEKFERFRGCMNNFVAIPNQRMPMYSQRKVFQKRAA